MEAARKISTEKVCVICDAPAWTTEEPNVQLPGTKVECAVHGKNSGRPISTLGRQKTLAEWRAIEKGAK